FDSHGSSAPQPIHAAAAAVSAIGRALAFVMTFRTARGTSRWELGQSYPGDRVPCPWWRTRRPETRACILGRRHTEPAPKARWPYRIGPCEERDRARQGPH